ncbi:MAG TPA: hypothetical protein PKN33_03080 [Phycisphaerae bacterium]|nr:hypothetical protein [Phycisphaerae bacterium]
MILQISEISPEDRKHLHCSDPRVHDEIAAVNRSLNRLDESIPTWTYLEPSNLDGKEVN